MVYIDLNRTETARVADAFDVVHERHRRTKDAADVVGAGTTTFNKHRQRLASSQISSTLLGRLAKALKTTPEAILGGRGPKPTGEGPNKPRAARRFTRLAKDDDGGPSQLRLEDDGDMIELVDEQVTSREKSRRSAGINGRVMLTNAEAVWLCASLGTLLATRSPEVST